MISYPNSRIIINNYLTDTEVNLIGSEFRSSAYEKYTFMIRVLHVIFNGTAHNSGLSIFKF